MICQTKIFGFYILSLRIKWYNLCLHPLGIFEKYKLTLLNSNNLIFMIPISMWLIILCELFFKYGTFIITNEVVYKSSL